MDIKKGLPTKTRGRRFAALLAILFFISSCLAVSSIPVLDFWRGQFFNSTNNYEVLHYITVNVIGVLAIQLCSGVLQIILLRQNFTPMRIILFILIYFGSGVLGGLIAGISQAISVFQGYSEQIILSGINVLTGLIMGIVIGFITGMGSLLLISKFRNRLRWLTYSIIIHILIWSLWWMINGQLNNWLRGSIADAIAFGGIVASTNLGLGLYLWISPRLEL